MSELPTNGGFAGAAWFLTPTGPFNAMTFLIEQIIAGRAFACLFKVQSVTGGTASGTPPRVSGQPMVNQIDGLGNQTPHGTVYNLPCFRLQGGNGAIVLDPVVSDIGVAVICDRDISNVKATAAVSGPGSWRQNDWADGCYFGGFLNGAPTQYVGFGSGGVSIVTPGTLTISAANITLDGAGNLSARAEVTAGAGGADQVGLQTHLTTGVQSGGGISGPPKAGS